MFSRVSKKYSMRKMGLEPTRHECHKILSLARLPVPTLPQTGLSNRPKNILLYTRLKVNTLFSKYFS